MSVCAASFQAEGNHILLKVHFCHTNIFYISACKKRFVGLGLLGQFFCQMLDYNVSYWHASSSTRQLLDSVYHSALRFITSDV